MANENKRFGCGCLPLLVLFFIGSILLAAIEDVTGRSLPSGLIGAAFAAVVLVALVSVMMKRRRQSESEDPTGGSVPASQSSRPAPPPSTPAPAPPRPRTTREVRSGARSLSTEPEDEDSKAFKQRLAEAVADLADNVEEMPDPGEGGRRMTSEEMIARAKRRIASFGDSD